MDAGAGSCLLADSQCRRFLEETLMRDQGERVEHQAWVIMPNHVHLLSSPRVEIGSLLKIWKGVSARRIGKGSIWQRNYRDTLVRDSGHFANAVRYIRRNPRRLSPGTFTLWESERALAVP